MIIQIFISKNCNLESINKFLNFSTYVKNQNITLKNAHNFIFGNHGFFKKQNKETNIFEKCIKKFSTFTHPLNRNEINFIFKNLNLNASVIYYKLIDLKNFEFGFKIKFFNKTVQWVITYTNNKINHFIFWKGGGFYIKNNKVSRTMSLHKCSQYLEFSTKFFWSKINKKILVFPFFLKKKIFKQC